MTGFSKRGMVILFTLLFLLISTPLAFARDTNYTLGSSFSWSPSSWYVSYATTSSTVVGYFNNIKFSSSAASDHNLLYYLTLEINNTTDNVGHSGWYSSNLPNAKFDRDDDNKNGYSEEAEAYEWGNGSISSSTSYYFNTSWNANSGQKGTFDYIVQRSALNPTKGEMEAIHFDLIARNSWVK